jgi:hypothetical protein
LVIALQGVFMPAVADHGFTHGAAPCSNSVTIRAETSEYKSRRMSTSLMLSAVRLYEQLQP